MKILAVNGSSRPFGNNYNILKKCLETFNSPNDTTELIQLCDSEIKNCTSCYTCKKAENKCPIQDDMTLISEKVIESDVLILSSPVYMWQVSAKTKLFMERLYPFFHFDKPSDLKGKKLILVFTQATPDSGLFQAYFDHIKASMDFLGFDVIKVAVLSGLRMPDDYTKHLSRLNEITDFSTRDCVI